MKSATGKCTRNGWTLGSDENIEDRGPGTIVERKARPNEIASHHARVGVREIGVDSMDQLVFG